ncbi:uncharacterized protein LOC132944766 [Metopolophium dirhodum]|uniref:uncharacterized protein LOC132944766 n=1 Tax=Metopolophium dirhodum TaxID=44670 RepID=UPI00298F76F6|nr:uncharacterized protein LOC132944766 [Metopolophium dirhodum]
MASFNKSGQDIVKFLVGQAVTAGCKGRYRYSFDKRLIPVWMLYACLNVYVVHYNYLEGVRYVAGSFRTCFEESYCFALIELLNRNLGPSSNVMCSMFYGRWHKIAGLAGAERTLQFLDDTRDAVPLADRRGLSRAVWYAAPASLAAYASMSQIYMILVPPTVVAAYWFNGMGQMVVYILVFVQYYVLARGFSRVNDMVEALDVARDPVSAGRLLARLTSVYDELCTLAGHVNRAYAPEMLLQWAYNIIRVIMVVFRLMEIAYSLDGPMAWATPYLLVQHLGELFIFVLHTSCVCTVGDRLSSESKRILASLENLRLRNRVNMNIEIKKAVDIFYVRATARNVYASIGGFIIFNMSLIRCVCSVLATYVLVLIQFRDQKGNSKPLYYNWN